MNISRSCMLLVAVLLYNCGNSNKSSHSIENAEVITVNVDEKKDIGLSSFISEFEYHVLKTPEDKLIGEILKIVYNDEYYAFFDPSRYTIWIYDKELNFVKDIEITEGEGPGEIRYFSDIRFGNDNTIYALGVFKVLKFDVEGNLLKETPINFQASKLMYLKSEDLLVGYMINAHSSVLDSKKSYNLIYFDDNGRVKQGNLPIDDRKKGMSFFTFENFPHNNNEHLFFSHLDYNIYELNGLDVEVKYTLDFRDYNIPDHVFDLRSNYAQQSKFMDREIESKKYVYSISKLLSTRKFMYILYKMHSRSIPFIYDKVNKEGWVASMLFNDIDNGIVPYFYATEENSFLGIIESNKLVNHLYKLRESNTDTFRAPATRQLINISKKIDNYSNPIFVKAKSNE